MPRDAIDILVHGGKACVEFLQFSLFSARPDGVFVFLTHEFAVRPTARGAVALYDLFLAPGAPARVSAEAALPPRNLALPAAVAPLRATFDRLATFTPTEESPAPPPVPIPPRHLFDAVVDALHESVVAVVAEFDPDKGPVGSLPNGRLTAPQRAWVETVWCKRVRPQLVAAGFGRVSSLGQP